MNNKLYEELRKRKESGEKLDWNKISKDELKELFDENIPDSMIAELYEISKSKVTYKRNSLRPR